MIIINEGTSELVIKKSRFIAISKRILCRDEVKPFIDILRAKHPFARHICYAFVADERGDDFGYDDDGEPSGTAGKPIYSALAAADGKKTCIAVVRYFGGIKLGAGGLTRAYRESAANLIERAGAVMCEKSTKYSITTDGETFKRVKSVLRGGGCVIGAIEYACGVSCEFSVREQNEQSVISSLIALNLSPNKIEQTYVPVTE